MRFAQWSLADKWKLTRAVLAPPYFTSTDKLVAIALLVRKNRDTGQCNPSLKLIAKDICKSARTVTNSLARLSASGCLKITYRRGSAQYDFLRTWRSTPEAAEAVRKVDDDAQRIADHRRDPRRCAIDCVPPAQQVAHLATQQVAHLKGENRKGKKGKDRDHPSLLPVDDIRAREPRGEVAEGPPLRETAPAQRGNRAEPELLLPINGKGTAKSKKGRRWRSTAECASEFAAYARARGQ